MCHLARVFITRARHVYSLLQGECRETSVGGRKGQSSEENTAFLRQAGGVNSDYLLDLSLEADSILVKSIRTLEQQGWMLKIRVQCLLH